MPQPVPAHDLWTTLALLQERLAVADPTEVERLQGHVALLEGRLAQCAPPSAARNPEVMEATLDLDLQWATILAEAKGEHQTTVPEAIVSRPTTKTLPPRMMFSPEFLALDGDLPADWSLGSEASNARV